MNNTEREIEVNVDNEIEKNARTEESTPECKNGVCELNWHPKRPQAA